MMGTAIMTRFLHLRFNVGTMTNRTGISGVILHPGRQRDAY
jgi:hypothetical protein